MIATRRALLVMGLAAPFGLARAAPDMRRIAYFSQGMPTLEAPRRKLSAALAKVGFTEGRNLSIDARLWDDSQSTAERDRIAAQILAGQPEAIIAMGREHVSPLARLTRTIPIVASLHDPVIEGFAKSITKPGGNVTGLSGNSPAVVELVLWLLGEVVPGLKRIHALASPSQHRRDTVIETRRRSAEARGYKFVEHDVESEAQALAALASIRHPREEALVMAADAPLDHAAFAAKAQRRGIASVDMSGHLESGYLMTGWLRYADYWGSIAGVVSQVLHGVDPATIPFVQPTHVEVALNRKAAAASGITFPQEVLLRATQFID